MNFVLKMPDIRERLNALGSEPAGSTPEENGGAHPSGVCAIRADCEKNQPKA
jgi:hypothetical protein